VAMRLAVAFLELYPDKDAEMAFALDLGPSPARCAATTTAGGTATGDAVGEVSYGHPWAHYSGGHQDRLLGGPL
jgi:hypothetical protein